MSLKDCNELTSSRKIRHIIVMYDLYTVTIATLLCECICVMKLSPLLCTASSVQKPHRQYHTLNLWDSHDHHSHRSDWAWCIFMTQESFSFLSSVKFWTFDRTEHLILLSLQYALSTVYVATMHILLSFQLCLTMGMKFFIYNLNTTFKS